MKVLLYSVFVFSLAGAPAADQAPRAERGYVLGPQDSLNIRVVDLEEFDPKSLGPVRVDEEGNIRLPLAGRIRASGITCEELEKEISRRLSGITKNPEVTVSVAEFRSHPVSIMGAVKNPGVYHQITFAR